MRFESYQLKTIYQVRNQAEIEIDSDDEDAAKDAAERAERTKLKTREVFLSRQVETLPATLIRGRYSLHLNKLTSLFSK